MTVEVDESALVEYAQLAGKAMRSNECRIVRLPRIDDSRGSLISIDFGVGVPFAIRRAFYIFGIPVGAKRAGHALKTCEEFILAVSGAFDAVSDDGKGRSRIRLASPDCGLYVPALSWLELENFTLDAVCLVFASEPYGETSHIRSYDEFKAAAAA